MTDEWLIGVINTRRLFERIEGKVIADQRAGALADNPSRKHIDHQRDVHETVPRRGVGEV